MGYRVEVRGQVTLHGAPEAEVAAALRGEMLRHDGWLTDESPIATLADLSEYSCSRIVCDGTVVSFQPLGESSDSKWSYQTSAFYTELGRWVSDGELVAEGEDGVTWRYRYQPGSVTQEGRNVWAGIGPGTTSFATDPRDAGETSSSDGGGNISRTG